MTLDEEQSGHLHALLHALVAWKASDLYMTVGAPPCVRVEGEIRPIGNWTFTSDSIEALLRSFVLPSQLAAFERLQDLNIGLSLPSAGRFRINIHRQRGAVGVVVRRVRSEMPTLEGLGLPPIVGELSLAKRGLVLVVGAAGSGKSTLTAAMLDHRNKHSSGHIVTVEDPIEFVHEHRQCIVTQREVGVDTPSFASALQNSLRQAPDVIFIGEVRDVETMEVALAFAETGHLCLATMHANSASQAVERIAHFFPVARHPQIFLLLSLNVRALIAQRLIPSVDGRRVAALEIMLDTPLVRERMKRGEVGELKDAMRQGAGEGCRTFDESLLELHGLGKITEDRALANADAENDLRIRLVGERLRADDPIPLRPAPLRFRT